MDRKLNNEEKKLLESFENDEWKSIPDKETGISVYKEIATNTLKKDKRINIRINSNDLLELKRKAMHEGIPYQTFISSILHKYVNNKYAEKTD
jgi:predicted DNA binding CopG/RHH family protein